jgi:hypothetical protein
MEHSDFFFDTRSSTIACIGQSSSGKTTWTTKVLQEFNKLFSGQSLEDIMIVYEVYQDEFYGKILQCANNERLLVNGFDLPKITEFCEKPPDEDKNKARVLILDDCLRYSCRSDFQSFLIRLFTVLASHNRIHVFLLLQSVHSTNRAIKTALENSKYLVVMRGFKALPLLQRVLLPGEAGILTAVSKLAWYEHKQNYLIVDSKTLPEFRYKTKIFADDEYGLIFVPVS